MTNTLLDVAIIGGGPSGSTLAYHLKKNDPHLNIGIFDKAVFPRYKACGGGISEDVFNYIDFSLNDVISYESNEVSFIHNKKAVTLNQDHLIYMVRREAFDELLINKAKDLGVETHLGVEVTDLQLLDSIWHIKTNQQNQVFQAKICALAEGSLGKLAKKLGIATNNLTAAAIEYEHYADQPLKSTTINFDFNHNGYAWTFPKNDGISIGIAGFIKHSQKDNLGLPVKLKNYMNFLNIDALDKHHLHGHPIQLYSGRKKLAHKQIILVGEIAGCVDPLTGEGIRPAIKNAYIAAQVINEALKKKDFNLLANYDKEFHKHIGKDYQYSRIFSYFFNKYQARTVSILMTPEIIQKVIDVFRNKQTYKNLISMRNIMLIMKRIFFK